MLENSGYSECSGRRCGPASCERQSALDQVRSTGTSHRCAAHPSPGILSLLAIRPSTCRKRKEEAVGPVARNATWWEGSATREAAARTGCCMRALSTVVHWVEKSK